MKYLLRILAIGAAFVAGATFAAPGHAAETVKTHHIVFQIDQNDPAVMNLVLNNVANLLSYYNGKGEQADVEVVAYGPGLNMLREDKSPVKARLKSLKEGSFPSKVAFSACGNTKKAMEKKEGHAVPIVPQASMVPAGVVRLAELQEKGWSYIRP